MTDEDGWHRWFPMRAMIAPPDLWGSRANVVSTPLQGPKDHEVAEEWPNNFEKVEKLTSGRHHEVHYSLYLFLD